LKNLTKIWFFALFILIVVLFIHDNVRTVEKTEGFTITNYLEDPQKFGGFKTEYMVTNINISPNHFYVNMAGENVKVYGSEIKKPILGQTVLFIHFRKDGIIELIDYHNYNYNYFLYGVSIFALIIFIIIFFREWKVTWRGFKDA